MPNAKDLKDIKGNVLIVGDSGTHKTEFLSQIPKNFVYDFDKGMAIARGRDVEYETYKEAPKGRAVPPEFEKDGLYNFATTWPKFMLKLQQQGDLLAKKNFPFQVISFDSLTFMSDIAMNHVLMVGKDELPHQGSYGAQQKYLQRVLDEVTTWPIRFVCTAHIQRDKNDLTGITEKLPLLTGKLAGRISTYFDEVWYTETEGSGPSKKYYFLTEPTPDMRQAKTRLGVPNRTEMKWEAVRPYLEGTMSVRTV